MPELRVAPQEVPALSLRQYVEGISDLYAHVAPDLRKYYGEQADSPRVERFLQWLEANGERLLADLKSDARFGPGRGPRLLAPGLEFSPASAEQVLGVWLGQRYLIDMYGVESPHLPTIQVQKGMPSGGVMHSKSGVLSIQVDPGQTFSAPIEALIVGFNLGLHESTHGLLALGGKPGELSELATFLVQTAHGLPLDTRALFRFSDGARDFSHLWAEYRRGALPLIMPRAFLGEYLPYLMGPWLKAHLGDSLDIRSLTLSSEPVPSLASPAPLGFWPFGAHPANDPDPAAFCALNGIREDALGPAAKELQAKVAEAFARIKAIRPKKGQREVDDSEFLQQFVRIMDEVFGKPKPADLPPGFASREPLGGGLRDRTS